MSIKREFLLRRQKDFDNVFENGNNISHPKINIKYIFNQLDYPRMAVIISKKVLKKAVQRNTLKRRIKEVIRPIIERMKNIDIVFIPKKEIFEEKFSQLKETIIGLIEKEDKKNKILK
jgi:ribonuclease P protein component